MSMQYSMSRTTTTIDLENTTKPIAEIITPSLARPKIVEIIVDYIPSVAAATSFPTVGIGISNPAGTNFIGPMANSPFVPIPQDFTTNSSIMIVTEWQTPPGLPTQFFRRANMPGTANSPTRVWWQWPRGLVVPTSNSMSIWVCNTNAAGVYSWNITVELES